MAHNKTLAAQLYGEFKGLFPDNAVEYFVSYYDYYQPEAYVPSTDTYIEKDSQINEEIDRMRHSATRGAHPPRRDRRGVGVAASMASATRPTRRWWSLAPGRRCGATPCCGAWSSSSTSATISTFHRGTFRVRGDVVEVFPADEGRTALRIEWFGDEIESIAEVDPLARPGAAQARRSSIFPGSHYVTPREQLGRAHRGNQGRAARAA